MKTRNKFLIVVGIIITAGIFLSSAATYITAKKQLESTAREQMERLVILIAAQSRLTLDLLKRDVQVLAELPLVHQTIAFPDNLEVVAATCRFFRPPSTRERSSSPSILSTVTACASPPRFRTVSV